MKIAAFRWFVLLLIPGCLLVQPLDEPKPDGEDSGSAGSGNSSGKPAQAGSSSHAGAHSGGSPAASGSGGSGEPIAECIDPAQNDTCEDSEDCCQTDNGAVCLSDDYFCHAICYDDSDCASNCCVPLEDEAYGACADVSYCSA